MKDLLEVIAKNLVDYPEKVTVKEVQGEHSMILELHVAPEDMGKVIGRRIHRNDTITDRDTGRTRGVISGYPQ